MNLSLSVCKMMKWTKVAMAVATVLILGPAVAQAVPVDITTLPGYEVVTSGTFNFGPNGWAGWSISTGKVVLGAEIISSDPISEFSVFRPAGPNEVFPHYTYGANEYGFVLQNALNGPNNDVQMSLYYADPLAGYTITESSVLNYGPTGWGGWSAPAGQVVSGGGYQFLTNGLSPVSSQVALEGSVWPHYTYGDNEQGWVVQNGNTGGQANLYVISFDAPAPAPVPEPATMLLLGSGLVGLVGFRKRFKKRVGHDSHIA
jgi:hypothetical protein